MVAFIIYTEVFQNHSLAEPVKIGIVLDNWFPHRSMLVKNTVPGRSRDVLPSQYSPERGLLFETEEGSD